MSLPVFKAKGVLSVIALVLPLGLAGITIQEQKVQAQQSDSTETSTPLADGVYLYGNTPQPNQIQHTYIVFEKEQDKVVGAFYTPYSEFACFAGEHTGNQLEVAAISPQEPQGFEATAKLDELHSIDAYSANDQRILSICKQDMSDSNL